MKARLLDAILRFFLPAVLLLSAGACTDEVNTVSPAPEEDKGDMPVTVRATTSTAGYATRSNMGPEEDAIAIKDRTLLFTYPTQPNGKMASAYCMFDKDGYGYIYTDNSMQEPLLWKDIYMEVADSAVYLDNLVHYPVQEAIEKEHPQQPQNSGYYYQTDNYCRIEFRNKIFSSDNYNGHFVEKYTDDERGGFYLQMIALADSERANQLVDIIWGKQSIAELKAGKSINFLLERKMSAISFRFSSEDAKIQQALGEEEVSVWLDNVCIWLQNHNSNNNKNIIPFSRRTGNLFGTDATTLQPNVYLVAKTKLCPIEQDDEAKIYSTPQWIFPPFKFGDKSGNTKLTIDLGDELGEYIGSFPKVITYYIYDAEESEWVSIPNSMEFKQGYHLIFNVKLKDDDDDRNIVFQNVQVEPMQWRFDENSEAKESGIYTWDDLATLAKTYNSNSTENNYRLLRYGKYDTQWTFALWDDIKVAENTKLPEKFEDQNYKIEFKNHHIKVGDDKITDMEQFHNSFSVLNDHP